jgi:uncharacterized protein YdcH (DUF465 family)
MSDSQHDLVHEFPEFKDKIHQLKTSDAHFRSLFERYHEVNKHVMGAEHRTELMSQAEEEKLRLERVQLKDELYQLLSKA